MSARILLALSLVFALGAAAQAQKDRATKVREDKARLQDDERWIYNDLPRGLVEAKKSGKPLLVVFRCIPCEACSRFDDLVLKGEKRIQELMDKFVCVRIVQANRMDLDLFQFDYDQSFHAFLMNADKTIYGRFGTRSEHKDEFQDMTMEGFAEALKLALDWHGKLAKIKDVNGDLFAAKHGPPPAVKSPEEYATLKDYKANLDYEGNVVKSCMHCHQIRDAEREALHVAGKPLPDKILYPYPLPHSIGLVMDPRRAATVKEVMEGSPAASAGFRAGDEIHQLAGQPLLSIADIQWVLHNAGDSAEIPAKIRRGGQDAALVLTLPDGWRKLSDISWRPTTWHLRGWGTGGLVLGDLPEEQRKERGLDAGALALEVKYVGQYNQHAAGKNAGFQKGDVIVEVDGKTDRMTETSFLEYTLNSKKPGDKVAATVLRGDKRVELKLPIQ